MIPERIKDKQYRKGIELYKQGVKIKPGEYPFYTIQGYSDARITKEGVY